MEEKGKPIEIGSEIKTYSFKNCSPDTIKDFIKSNINVGDLIGVHTQNRYMRGVVKEINYSYVFIINEVFCAPYGEITFIEIYNKKVMKDKECACPIFRVLEKMGLRWNPEKEETEEAKKQRWRAKEGEPYYYIESNFSLVKKTESSSLLDKYMWDVGNYFRYEDEAWKYVKEIRRMLQERTLDKEE